MSNALELFIEKAGSLPLVRVSREDFLKETFFKKEPNLSKLQQIVKMGPLAAGMSKDKVDKIADSIITQTLWKASATSFVTGLPGGVFMVATIPADITQLYGHVFILIQKMLYLYGYTDDVFDANGQLDEGTKLMITVLLGSVLGIEAANTVLKEMSIQATKMVAIKTTEKIAVKGSFLITNKLANKFASIVAPKFVAKISAKIVAQTTVKSLWSIAGKTIPVLSGVLSGVITTATLKPLAKKLKLMLSEELCNLPQLTAGVYYDKTDDIS